MKNKQFRDRAIPRGGESLPTPRGGIEGGVRVGVQDVRVAVEPRPCGVSWPPSLPLAPCGPTPVPPPSLHVFHHTTPTHLQANFPP
jgi:hypothetical protein